MDTSALFNTDVFSEEVKKNFHVGDLNIGENLDSDDDVDIVLTVGDLVKMYNNEDTSANKDSDILSPAKKKFERIEVIEDSKQTQSEITVDFRAVAGKWIYMGFYSALSQANTLCLLCYLWNAHDVIQDHKYNSL